MMTSSPGSRRIEPILWLKVFLDSRLQYQFLEALPQSVASLIIGDFLLSTLCDAKAKVLGFVTFLSLCRSIFCQKTMSHLLG